MLGSLAQYLLAALSGYLVGSIPLHSLMPRVLPARPNSAKAAGHVLDAVKTAVLFFVWFYNAGFYHHDYIVFDEVTYLVRELFDPSAFSRAYIAGAFVVVGHGHPAWRKLAGGSGVIPFVGLLFASCWSAGVAFAVAWLVAACSTRRPRLASVIATAVAPVYMAFSGELMVNFFWNWLPEVTIAGPVEFWYVHYAVDHFIALITAALAVLIAWRHRADPRAAV